ncbi:zinc finger protein 1035 [Osmerus eperlanus]|uniref:zinc finger protein 1035 n=1 Tax=Osmerus eperlanus TaxID=29151 RepID=UPI002E0DD453
MAHGWNSFLQSQSSHSRTLRVPLDSEEHLAHLQTFIENQDLTNLVESKEAPSSESDLNSNFTGCQLRDEGQQPGQEKRLRCGEGALSNIVTGTVADSQGLPSSLEADLHDVIHDCDMLNPSLIEDYSVVGTCTESIVGNMKPNCKELYEESNLHSVTQGHDSIRIVPSSEGFCPDESSESRSGWAEKHTAPESEQKEDWKDAQKRMEVKDADKPPAVSPSAYKLECQTKDCMNGKKQEEGCFEEREELCMIDELSDFSAAASGSPRALECDIKHDQPNASQDSERECEDSVLHGNLPPGATEKLDEGTQERGQQQEVEMEKNMTAEQVYDTISKTSASQSVFCRREVDVVDDEEEWVQAEEQLSTRHEDKCQDISMSAPESLATFENEAKDHSNGNMLVNEKEAWRKQGDQSATVSFSDHSKEFLEKEVMPSSTQGPGNLQDGNILDYQDSDKKLNDCNIDFLSHCVALCNSEPQSQTVDDWISPIKETDTAAVFKEDQASQDPHMYHMQPPHLFRDGIENAREAFQEKDHDQDPPFLNVCYGEPLSREDSIREIESKCEAFSESNHQVEGDYTVVNKTEGEDTKDVEDPAPQIKTLQGISKYLQPVVLLKSLKPSKNCEVDEFLCAKCKHAELKVDHIIEHHYCNHSQHKLQLCASCNTYLTNTDLAKEHLCGIADETQPISSESSLEGRALTLPGVYKCRYCFKMFPYLKELNQHERSHLHQTPFKCNRCGRCFSQKCGLNKHKQFVKCQSSCAQIPVMKLSKRNTVENTKSAEPPTDIPTEEAFGNLTDCFVKLVDVYKTNFCNMCLKSFTSRMKLKKHKLNVHHKKFETSFTHVVKSSTQEKVPKGTETCAKFKCPICPRMFKYSYNRARHLREQCIRQFTLQSKGRVGKTFQCPLCHATFLHSSNRTKHLKMKCLKEYNSKHLKTKSEHIKNIQQKEKKSVPLMTSYQKKVFHCNLCPATYAHYSGLFRHKKKHELYKNSGKVIKYRNSNLSKDTATEDTPLLKKDRSLPISCQVCGKTFMTFFSLNKHLHVHRSTEKEKNLQLKQELKNRNQIKCPLCDKVFQDVHTLLLHCLKHSTGSNSHQCPFCKRHFTQRQSMRRHMTMHILEKPFPCQICKKRFYRKEYAMTHQEKCLGHTVKSADIESKDVEGESAVIVSKVTPPKAVVNEGKECKVRRQTKKMNCSYCPRVFTRVMRLTAHHKSHKLNMLVPCTKCNQFFGRNKFKAHVCQPISNACKCCGKAFARKCNRVFHEKTCTQLNKNRVGRDKLLLKCPQCPRRFRYRCYLLRHLPSHTRGQYACMHCGQTYTNQSRYLQHEAFCDGAKQIQTRLNHLNTNALLSKSGSSEAKHQSQADIEGQYKCKFCTKAFMKSRNLRRHILTHTEVKPYRCKACDGCFSRHDHLKRHQMHCKGKSQRLELCIAKVSLEDVGRGWQNKLNVLKKGEQDVFHCSSCLKYFSSRSNLRRHVSMSHVSVKPFRCNRCGNFYTLEKTLKKHRSNRCCSKSTQAEFLQQNLVTRIPNNELNQALESFQQPLKNKRKYVCKYCPRTLKSSEQLKVHTRLHTGDKPFGCANCGERFIRRDYLKRHLVKCNLMGEHLDTLCERCGVVFSTDTIENHLKACTIRPSENRLNSCETITKSPPSRGFPCANCNARFLLFSQLQLHFLNTHREEANLNSPKQALPLHQQLSNVMNIKEEPLDDSYGNSNLSTNDNLAFNENADSDNEVDKPFSCTLCQMRFVRKGGLNMHMSAHLGNFPFNCKRCMKGFWSKSQYRRHVAKCRHPVSMIKEECSIQCDTEVTSEMGSTENDTVLVFNQGSKTTGTGVLQTNFSCKDDLKEKTQGLLRNPRKESLMDKTKVVQYQCSECDLSFTDGLLLISHLEDHGRQAHEQKLAICQKCGKKCTSSKNLERHMKVHDDEKEYSCPECPMIFLYTSELDIHRSYHDPNRPFACIQCNQRFWTTQSLDRHDIEEHSEIHTCQFCKSSFTAKSSLVRHCRMRHKIKLTTDVSGPVGVKEKKDASNERVDTNNETEGSGDNDSDSAPYFPCHVCGKTFLTSESLEDHQRCHLGEKPHECAECGKCFFQAAQLQQHQRSHKSEFQCQTCGRGFVSLFALRKHKHTHGRRRPHRCPKCLLSFTGHLQLAEHMATHRDDNFPCDICDETFSCRTSRAEHRKVHTEPESGASFVIPTEETTIPSTPCMSFSEVEDMKYRCGVCSDRFKNPEQLSEHGCMAATERSYSCLQCNKHFLHGSHLKKHQLSVHQSQSYMYLCDQCHMSFAYHKHYLNHLKKHCKREFTADIATANTLKMVAEKIFKCPICPLSFDHAVALSSHLSIHSKTVHKCRICKLPFSSKSKLADHERCHLTAATEYECTECAQTFLGSDAFRQHQCSRRQRADTNSELPHTSTSKSSVTSKQAVEEEEVDVGEDFFNCVDCPGRFSSKPTLLEHQIKHHPVMFKCELCEKTFHLKKYLTKHQRRHQKKMENMQRKGSQLMCSVCPKVLCSTQDLQMHMRMHAEQKIGPHRCDMCYKSFGHLSLLRHHQESHIGQVVYECTECDKAFAFPNLLDQHQKTHTVPNM